MGKPCQVILLILFLTALSFADEREKVLLDQTAQDLHPLPAVLSSPTNPITPEKVKLGRMLFYETQISVDGTVSCARCHPISLYAADRLKKAIGNNARINARNAPTLLNAAGQISAH